MRIAISGYYGSGNLGDEAVLGGILATLSELGIDARPSVLSADPERTLSEHPGVEAVHRYSPVGLIRAIRAADVTISGGGSLFQDVTSARSLRYYTFVLRLAQRLRHRTMVYAQGVGPLRSQSSRRTVATTLNRVQAITVRDADSKTLLESIGVRRVPVVLSADPSFVLEPDQGTADAELDRLGLVEGPLVGVSLRPWPGAEAPIAEACAGVRRACEALRTRAVAIPMQPSEDREICAAAGVGPVIGSDVGARAVKGIAARCDLVVGMRLHSLMFAASAGVPFVALAYDPKVESFARAAGQQEVIPIHQAVRQGVADAILRVWDERASRAQALRSLVPEFRRLALASGEALRKVAGRS